MVATGHAGKAKFADSKLLPEKRDSDGCLVLMAKQATAETKMKVSVKKVSLPRKHAQQDKYVVMHGRVKEELEWECNDLWR